ncbi:MAG: SRPBCC family protein [Actinomycetota bacterium]|nr:SRPBCC family protein [Actinomycetota bacterium]
MTTTDSSTVSVCTDVNAPIARAFHIFTAEIGTWWDEDKHILQAPLAEMVFEPFVGGNIIDRGTDGSECRWARILAYEPPNLVRFSWDINTRWQIETDPRRTSEVEITFTEITAERTRVILTHRHLDRHGEDWTDMRDAVAGGWNLTSLAERVERSNHAADHELPIITDDVMRTRLAATSTYTTMLLRTTSAFVRPAVDSIIWEHGRRNMALAQAGALAIVLPVTDDSDLAGIGVFATTPDNVHTIMEDDPGVRAGIFSYDLYPVRGFPGAALP